MNKISNYFKYIYYYVNVKDSYLLIIIPHFVYLFCICLSHYSYSSSPRKISLIFPFPERTGGSLFWTTMVPYTCFYFCTITPCLIVSVCVCVCLLIYLCINLRLEHCGFLSRVSFKSLCLLSPTSLIDTMVSRVPKWPHNLCPLVLCSWLSYIIWQR